MATLSSENSHGFFHHFLGTIFQIFSMPPIFTRHLEDFGGECSPEKNPIESYQIMLNAGFDPLQCTMKKCYIYMIVEKKTQWTSSFVADCSNKHPYKHPNKHPKKTSPQNVLYRQYSPNKKTTGFKWATTPSSRSHTSQRLGCFQDLAEDAFSNGEWNNGEYHPVIKDSNLKITIFHRYINNLFLWAIYTMAILVITRWYIFIQTSTISNGRFVPLPCWIFPEGSST